MTSDPHVWNAPTADRDLPPRLAATCLLRGAPVTAELTDAPNHLVTRLGTMAESGYYNPYTRFD